RAARNASSVFSGASSARPRWAMRRGRGPGRKREAGAPGRSGLLLVDEGILFLLVLAPSTRADGASGAMVCGVPCAGPRGGPGRRDGVRVRRGDGDRGVVLAGRCPRGGLGLLRGEVLELAAQAEDQGAGEEQREDPPLEGVGEMGSEARLRRRERQRPVRGRLL